MEWDENDLKRLFGLSDGDRHFYPGGYLDMGFDINSQDLIIVGQSRFSGTVTPGHTYFWTKVNIRSDVVVDGPNINSTFVGYDTYQTRYDVEKRNDIIFIDNLRVVGLDQRIGKYAYVDGGVFSQ